MNAVVIILELRGAVFSLSASLQWMGMKTVLGVAYRVAVRALVILLLAFTAQTIYQQVKLRKLQRELEEQHVQAEVFRRLAMSDPLTGLYNRRFPEQRERLSNSTRGSDLWGGDEFMMLLVDCEAEQLSRVLLRLEGFEVQVNGKTLPVSLAAGWNGANGKRGRPSRLRRRRLRNPEANPRGWRRGKPRRIGGLRRVRSSRRR
jgi:GGDEF domain-containing protein